METSFYYKRGKFETGIQWRRPTYDSVKSFLVDLQENTDIFKKYKLKILGKILVDIANTWDIDIHMHNIDGSKDIPEQLERDMNIIYHYGINRNYILPDISWIDCELPNISKTDYFSGNYTEFNHNRIKTVNNIKIINGETIFNDKEPINDTKVFLTKDMVLNADRVWPFFNDNGFKDNAKYRLEDYFVLENQIHFYDALNLIKSTPESFFRETNPLFRKTSKII